MIEAKLCGIRVRVQLLFWLIIGLSLMAGYFLETLTLFTIVLIHEMGHIAVARELGWKVTEVQLLPFGGVATFEEEIMADPLDEIVVALAGPFMNVMMIFVSVMFWTLEWWSDEWSRFFISSNLLIAGFNLLPIWPLDGGRIAQSLMFYLLSYRQAVLLSLGMSIFLAAVLAGIGWLHTHPNLLMVAIYLLFLNGQALQRFPYQFIRFLAGKYALHGDKKERRWSVSTMIVEPRTTAMQLAHKLKKCSAHAFLIQGDNMTVIDEARLLQAVLFEQKHQHPVNRL